MPTAAEPLEMDSLPVSRDRSFWGLAVGQFLGAFNDNVFKQLALLLCVDQAVRQDTDPQQLQAVAMLMFALPWVLFSGVAGFLSDRSSKQRGIVFYKGLEVVITLAGMAAFWSDQLAPVLAVLFCLSTHSTFFGPCKYGILPELFRRTELPLINGVFQMTTFLAIIFGVALAGFGKELLPDQAGLMQISLGCVGIAMFGTLAALLVRRTRAANPQLVWHWSSLGISGDTRRVLASDRFLLKVLLLTATFWFMGGVVQPTVNVLGRTELHVGDGRTSLLASCMGIGIALGCGLAAKLSRHRVRFALVTTGAWGISLSFAVLSAVGFSALSETAAPWLEAIAQVALIGLGTFAGMFVVPLQVVLQVTPPQELKGRMIGTMNLVNWIGILLSAAFVGGFAVLRRVLQAQMALDIPASSIFAVLAVLMLPLAILFRPADLDLRTEK